MPYTAWHKESVSYCFATGLGPSAVSEEEVSEVVYSARMMMWQPSVVGRIWTKCFGSWEGVLTDIFCFLRGALKRWLCGPRITIVLSVLLFLYDWRFSNNGFKAFQIPFFQLNSSLKPDYPTPVVEYYYGLVVCILYIYNLNSPTGLRSCSGRSILLGRIILHNWNKGLLNVVFLFLSLIPTKRRTISVSLRV